MSSTIIGALTLQAGREVIIYGGIPILVLGITGGSLNTLVFLSLRTFRQNSCAFYLTIMSIVNVGQLLTGFLSRIAINGFSVDWTEMSLFYCKVRYFILQLCALLSFTCMCLATIDQYCATSSRPNWQQWANIKPAHRLIIGSFLLWVIHGIPYLVYFDHIPWANSTRLFCSSRNEIFLQYHVYAFTLILTGFLPILITTLFACLAYRNVRRMTYRAVPSVRRELDKQLTVMVLVQVLINLFTALPSAIVNTIAFHAKNTTDRKIITRVQLIGSIAICLYYLSFASSFYLYLCVSDRFRRQFLYALCRVDLYDPHRRQTLINQVTPQ